MNDIATFPLEELIADRKASVLDRDLLSKMISPYTAPEIVIHVLERVRVNQLIIDAVDAELERRGIERNANENRCK